LNDCVGIEITTCHFAAEGGEIPVRDDNTNGLRHNDGGKGRLPVIFAINPDGLGRIRLNLIPSSPSSISSIFA
jgi:hypothetical protein